MCDIRASVGLHGAARHKLKKEEVSMKLTLTTNEAVRLLLEDEYANWSRDGATALVEYLDEIDPDMEFDAVAIRCDFYEYKSAMDATEDLYREIFGEEEEAVAFLEREGVLVVCGEFGVIVRNA